jgi:hypothetical protein
MLSNAGRLSNTLIVSAFVLCAVLLQVGGESLRAFANFLNPNLTMGRWSFYIIFGAVQLMLSMLSSATQPIHCVKSVSHCSAVQRLLVQLLNEQRCCIRAADAVHGEQRPW